MPNAFSLEQPNTIYSENEQLYKQLSQISETLQENLEENKALKVEKKLSDERNALLIEERSNLIKRLYQDDKAKVIDAKNKAIKRSNALLAQERLNQDRWIQEYKLLVKKLQTKNRSNDK